MVWDGNYWGSDGALAKAQTVFLESKKTVADHIAYASVCYSAATRAWAEAKAELYGLHIVTAMSWLWQSWKLGREALRYADVAYKKWSRGDINDLNLDQVDVILSVISRFGFFRKNQVKNILDDVFPLVKNDSCTAAPHTRAFIISHALQIGYVSKKTKFSAYVDLMTDFARWAEKDGEYAQAARVWKHVAVHWRNMDKEDEICSYATIQAERLAAISSPDQVQKIKYS
jgi:hypothetical protein